MTNPTPTPETPETPNEVRTVMFETVEGLFFGTIEAEFDDAVLVHLLTDANGNELDHSVYSLVSRPVSQ